MRNRICIGTSKYESGNHFRYISQMIAPAPNMIVPVTKRMGRNKPKIKIIAPIFISKSAWARLLSLPGAIFFSQ